MIPDIYDKNNKLIEDIFTKYHWMYDNDEFLNLIFHHFYRFDKTIHDYDEEILKRIYEINDKTTISRHVYNSYLDTLTTDLLLSNLISKMDSVSYIKIRNISSFVSLLASKIVIYILNENYELYDSDECGCYYYISEETFLELVYIINSVRYYNLIDKEYDNYFIDILLSELLNKITLNSEEYALYYNNSVIVIEGSIIIEDYSSNKKEECINLLKQIIHDEYENYLYYNMKIRRF